MKEQINQNSKIRLPLNPVGEDNFFNLMTINCFQCRKKIIVKWNKPRKKYSEKSNLGYYTEKQEDKEKWLCDKCIFKLYYQNKTKYWQLVPNLKKRQVLRSYIYLKSLKAKV